MIHSEAAAGAGQTIVIYASDDTGSEIDPTSIFTEVAEDAASRAGQGQLIISMAAVPTRHAAAFLGRQGSGYETKVAIAVVYSGPTS